MGLVESLQHWDILLICCNNQLKSNNSLAKTREWGTLHALSDVCVRNFLCSFPYFNKTLLHRSCHCVHCFLMYLLWSDGTRNHWGYWYFLEILIPACASSTPAILMMYSAYKLNKQGDDIQPWCTPFLIWNQSVVPCPVRNVASSPAYRFLRKQVRWSGIPISFRISHSLLC